jgi:hypothetical protein
MKFMTIGTAVSAALLISRSARANAGDAALSSDLTPALTTGSDLAAMLPQAYRPAGFDGFGIVAFRRGPKNRLAAVRRERRAAVGWRWGPCSECDADHSRRRGLSVLALSSPCGPVLGGGSRETETSPA